MGFFSNFPKPPGFGGGNKLPKPPGLPGMNKLPTPPGMGNVPRPPGMPQFPGMGGGPTPKVAPQLPPGAAPIQPGGPRQLGGRPPMQMPPGGRMPNPGDPFGGAAPVGLEPRRSPYPQDQGPMNFPGRMQPGPGWEPIQAPTTQQGIPPGMDPSVFVGMNPGMFGMGGGPTPKTQPSDYAQNYASLRRGMR